MAENAERTFQHFSELPSKIRAIMIDEMEPEERCRMTRCSKQLNKEAKASKKYIHSVHFHLFYPFHISIDVHYAKYERIDNRKLGFVLSFTEESEKKFKKTKKLDTHRVLHEEELGSSTDLLECAAAHLKELLESNQHCIRKLNMAGPTSGTKTSPLVKTDFDIDNWENLEVLDVCRNVDILKTLPKLRKPLKKLCIEGVESDIVANYKEIFEVQNDILWWDANLDNQQLLQFSTKEVTIHTGKLTEIDIFKFIRSWQNGTIGKDIEIYRWIVHWEFKIEKLQKLLRVPEHETEQIEIKHYIEHGRSASLMLERRMIRFNTGPNEDFRIFLF